MVNYKILHMYQQKKKQHSHITPSELTSPRGDLTTLFSPSLSLTFVPRDGNDVPHGGRHAVNVSTLDTPLRLHVVLEGAVDSHRQIGDVAGLEDQLGRKRDNRRKINGRTWCTWIVIRYDMKVNGC